VKKALFSRVCLNKKEARAGGILPAFKKKQTAKPKIISQQAGGLADDRSRGLGFPTSVAFLTTSTKPME